MSERSQELERLTFPPGMLGEPSRHLRAFSLAKAPGLLFVEKPSGVSAGLDPLWAEAPCLGRALRAQAEAQRRVFLKLGTQEARVLIPLPPEPEAVAVFALNAEAHEYWRNAYGSRLLEIHCSFLSTVSFAGPEETRSCELPLARHSTEPRMIVSHKTGKRARTEFRPLEFCEDLNLYRWQARTRYLRPWQVQIHAEELGLSLSHPADANLPSHRLRRLAKSLPLWRVDAIGAYLPDGTLLWQAQRPLAEKCSG